MDITRKIKTCNHIISFSGGIIINKRDVTNAPIPKKKIVNPGIKNSDNKRRIPKTNQKFILLNIYTIYITIML